jgi:hypothetical protein
VPRPHFQASLPTTYSRKYNDVISAKCGRGVNIVSWGQLIVAEVCDIGATAKTSEQTSKAAVEAPTIRAGLARLSMPRQCLDGAEFCICGQLR